MIRTDVVPQSPSGGEGEDSTVIDGVNETAL